MVHSTEQSDRQDGSWEGSGRRESREWTNLCQIACSFFSIVLLPFVKEASEKEEEEGTAFKMGRMQEKWSLLTLEREREQ